MYQYFTFIKTGNLIVSTCGKSSSEVVSIVNDILISKDMWTGFYYCQLYYVVFSKSLFNVCNNINDSDRLLLILMKWPLSHGFFHDFLICNMGHSFLNSLYKL